MEDFKLQLTGELDQNKSKTNINSDLVKIASAIDKLKVQAEIDQNSVKQIAQQLSNIMNQKVVVNNIQIDTTQASKAGEQAGQNIGDSLTKRLQSSLNVVKQNIENTIRGFGNQKLNSYDLTKMFNLNRSGIDASVIQNVRNLTNELNALAKEALKTNSDGSWEGIVNKISSLSKVLTQFGSGRDLTAFKESLDVLDYFQNKKIFVGSKDDVLANTGLSVKELNNQFRNLGVTFTTVKENSLQLDTIWEELFRINPNFQQFTNFGDQINAIVSHLKIAKEAMYGDSNLQPLNSGDVNKVLLDWLTNLENVSKKVNVFRGEQEELERRLGQSSTSSTNTVVQNEQKKQHAYQQTANAKKKVAESESLIKNNANVTTFAQSNNAARIARDEFEQLLQAENAVISVTERFGKNNNLTSFSLNIKRATGEVETLRYALENIGDKQNPLYVFKNSGAELNNSGAIKQIQAIENAFASFTQKIEQFKSTNHDKLSGIAQPLADFESKLNGLKTGTSTINEVKNAYKLLQAEVSKIDAPLKATIDRFSATKTAVDNGKKSISDYRETLKGLNNAPKELSQELTKASKLLMQINGIEKKEGTTANWSVKAREFTDLLDSIKGKITSLQKQQANGSTTTVYSKKDIENLLYVQKVMNTISKTEGELRTKLAKAGYTDIKIKGIEDATGKVKELEVTANNAAGALEKINFSRVKVQGGGKSQKIQDWLVQSGDVQVIKSATTAQEELTKSAQRASSNLADLKSKWESQGILVGDFKTKVEQLESSLATVGSKGELDKLTSQIRTLKTEASQIAEVNKIQLSMSTGGYESKVDSLIGKTQQWVDANGNARISTDALQTAMNNLNTAYANITATGGNTVANQQALIEAERALDTEVKKVQSSVTSMNATMAKSTAVDSLRQKVQMFYDTNSKAHWKWGKDLKNIMTQLASGAEVPITKMRQLEQEFIGIQNAARQAGKLGLSSFDKLKQYIQKFSYWTSSTFLIMKSVQEMKQMITTAKELDDALTNISYTMEVTESQLEKIGNASLQMAKDLNTSASNVLGAVKLYANAKETSDSILAKAQPAIMLSNVTGMTGENSAKMLQAVSNQFDLTQDDLMQIADTIEMVSQNMAYDFASGINEISQGIERSGSIAKDAGLNLQEYASMLGLVIEQTGQSGDTVGNAFKTIFQRITKASATEGTLEEDISAAEESLRAVGVQVRDSADEFRDLTDIMKDLGDVWDSLSSVQQSNISYNVAGIRQTNILKSLLNNWEQYEELVSKAENSSGTTLHNQEKYAESLSGKLKNLSAIWEKIGTDTFDSSFLKGMTDVGIGVSSLIEKFGLLKTAIVGIGAYAGFKNVGRLKMQSLIVLNCRQ